MLENTKYARSNFAVGLAICAASLLMACQSDDTVANLPPGDDILVDVAYDRDTSFSQYATFAFEEPSDLEAATLEGLDDAARADVESINREIAEGLRERGLTEVDNPDDADLLAFSLVRSDLDSSVEWECLPGTWGGYWPWGVTYDPCLWLDRDVQTYDTTVVAGVVDPERDGVVFVGFVHGIDGTLPSERREDIAQGVEEVFASYPVVPIDGGMPEAGVAEGGVEDAGGAEGGSGEAGAGDAATP